MKGSYVAIITSIDNRLVCKGTIVDMVSDTALVRLITPIKYLESDVTLIEYSYSKETFVYTGEIVSLSNDGMMTITNIKTVSTSERRRSFRVPLNSEAVLVSHDLGIDFVDKIVNISETGVLFTSDMNLSNRDSISIQMPLVVDDATVIFSGKVGIVRRAANEDDNKYQYGCKFNKLDNADSERLHYFVTSKKKTFFQKNIL